jgi:4-diphosphocytidyl-2-C-methyl-D-erythritol kinase
MICFPNAKINIGLRIVRKRPDGFHDIESVFYPVPFTDVLEVIEQKNWHEGEPKWQFYAYGIPVDAAPENNLIIKAYELLNEQGDLPPVEIHLYKHIPMGAGLGGGSADAAFMLKLLNDKFSLDISTSRLKELAAKLGSDCAFFIDNKPAYLFGKGHELQPCDFNLSGYRLVLLTPPFYSNTKLAYQYAQPRGVVNEHLLQLLAKPVTEWRYNIDNDFETSVFKSFPQLSEIKQQLYDAGAVYASMSGSGSSMFGLFQHQSQLPESLVKIVAVNKILT